jgi:alkylated DNA nucleotide flippase Atl1
MSVPAAVTFNEHDQRVATMVARALHGFARSADTLADALIAEFGGVLGEEPDVRVRGERQTQIIQLPELFSAHGLTVAEIARAIGYDEANTHTTVGTLEKQGLLEVAYNGRPRRYRLAIEHRRNKILRAARAIPVGRWASYGDVGIAATGNRNAARAVARSAARNPAFPTPWRVINGNATIPDGWHSGDGQGPEKCRALLEGEGIRFEDGKADPSHRIGWEELEPLIELDELPTEAPA